MSRPTVMDPVDVAIDRVDIDRFLSSDVKNDIKARLQSASDAELEWEAVLKRPREPSLSEALSGSASVGTLLGHVSLKDAFLRHLARVSGADYGQLLRLLDGLRGNDLAQDPADARVEWNLLVGGTGLRQRSEAWFFACGGPPLEAVPLERLPCCLGLHCKSGDIFLGFEVPRATLVGIRASCVLDVSWDYLPLWRSSGLTEPICDPLLPSDRGFPEYLAKPPPISGVSAYSLDIITA